MLREAEIDPVKIQEHLPDLGEASWPATFDCFVKDFSDSRYPTLSKMAETLYARWQGYTRNIGQTALQCIHGDLTLANSTVTDDHRLGGAFDLARVHVGDIAEECSTLLGVDKVLFEGCLRELREGGIAVNEDDVRLWIEMKDLHVLPYWILHGNLRHPSFIRLRDKVVKRYSGSDWSELYRNAPAAP